jgi:phosphate transport system substrate-binding protein
MKMTFCSGRFDWNGTAVPRGISLVLLGILIAGCSPREQTPQQSGSENKNENKIVIRGSNTFGEQLAPSLIVVYKKEHPSVDFDLEPKSTGYGLAALRSGLCDIAGASRLPTEAEKREALNRGIEFNEYVICSYSVAVVVNASNPVTSLTRDQVRDIFTGTIQNWKDVGGPDAPIQLYIRDPISGTHLGFQELAMENKPYGPNSKEFTGYGEIVKAVGQEAAAIGYASIDLANKDGVKAVIVDGIAPVAATVKAGQYPYARVLRLYTNKTNETKVVNDFIEFVRSARGGEIISQMGFVPHS